MIEKANGTKKADNAQKKPETPSEPYAGFGDQGKAGLDLAQRLKPLSFDAEQDQRSLEQPLVDSYLRHYRLPLAEDYPGLRQGLGSVHAAGFDLAAHYWLPARPRGCLIVVHGYFDHIGLYGHIIRYGLEQGWAVLGYDQPGHGLSLGARLCIDNFDHYADALQALLQQARPLLSSPIHSLGQSMGGAVLLNHLWRYGPEFTGQTALLAPLILPRGWRRVGWLHGLLKPWLSQIPRSFSDSSHDEDFNRFLERQDCLQDKHISLRWVGAMAEWHKRFVKLTERQEQWLVIQGDGDTTVDWHYNLHQLQTKLPRARTVMIPGAYHHLANESPDYRQPVFEALDEFWSCRSAKGEDST